MRKNPEAAPLEYAQRKKKRILPRALDQILFPWSTVKFFFTVHRTCKESLQVARTRIKNRTPAFNGGPVFMTLKHLYTVPYFGFKAKRLPE
jgi:hypothetical protein